MKQEIKKAIYYFDYGIKCDIFQEPVTSYAKTAISALEKQIPKKTVKGKIITGNDYCAVCHHFVQPPCDKYCSFCGHALDGSDTE